MFTELLRVIGPVVTPSVVACTALGVVDPSAGGAANTAVSRPPAVAGDTYAFFSDAAATSAVVAALTTLAFVCAVLWSAGNPAYPNGLLIKPISPLPQIFT
jgi:hypothetical protein